MPAPKRQRRLDGAWRKKRCDAGKTRKILKGTIMSQIETQSENSDYPVIVGIEGVRTKIPVNKNIFFPTITLKIGTGNNRGIHMSRLIESISEMIDSQSQQTSLSLEDYAKKVMLSLSKRHPFQYFEMLIKTELAITTQTPASKRNTIEVHDVSLLLKSIKDDVSITQSVSVIGSSSCPHALINNSHQRTHIQRSIINLSWTPDDYTKETLFEQLIEICNNSFSSPVYTLLKTQDEQAVINTMFEHPAFVEDIVRNVISNSHMLHQGTLSVNVLNQESIHRHNAIGEKKVRLV